MIVTGGWPIRPATPPCFLRDRGAADPRLPRRRSSRAPRRGGLRDARSPRATMGTSPRCRPSRSSSAITWRPSRDGPASVAAHDRRLAYCSGELTRLAGPTGFGVEVTTPPRFSFTVSARCLSGFSVRAKAGSSRAEGLTVKVVWIALGWGLPRRPSHSNQKLSRHPRQWIRFVHATAWMRWAY